MRRKCRPVSVEWPRSEVRETDGDGTYDASASTPAPSRRGTSTRAPTQRTSPHVCLSAMAATSRVVTHARSCCFSDDRRHRLRPTTRVDRGGFVAGVMRAMHRERADFAERPTRFRSSRCTRLFTDRHNLSASATTYRMTLRRRGRRRR